jgi:serine/threonine-protein kinase RsbW
MKFTRSHERISLCQTIPSQLDEVDSLCLKIRELLKSNCLGEACFGVELLARECLNNAVIHGNRGDAEKSIELSLFVGRKWIRLQVSDQGPGFAWRETRQKSSDTAASSGRGLNLYELYARRVEFNDSGNRITLWISKKNQRGGRIAQWLVTLWNRMTCKLR